MIKIETLGLLPLVWDTLTVYQDHPPFKLSFSCGGKLFVILKSDSLIINTVLFDNEDLIIYPNLISNKSYGHILDDKINSTFGPMTSNMWRP